MPRTGAKPPHHFVQRQKGVYVPDGDHGLDLQRHTALPNDRREIDASAPGQCWVEGAMDGGTVAVDGDGDGDRFRDRKLADRSGIGHDVADRRRSKVPPAGVLDQPRQIVGLAEVVQMEAHLIHTEIGERLDQRNQLGHAEWLRVAGHDRCCCRWPSDFDRDEAWDEEGHGP
jgi:hypothetical protein